MSAEDFAKMITAGAISALKEFAKQESVDFAKYMRDNGVYIANDEESDFAFDIGDLNLTAEQLFEKYKQEKLCNPSQKN